MKNLHGGPTPFGPQCLAGGDRGPVRHGDQVDRKSFSFAKEIAEDTQYGERVFAHKVIAAKATNVDFNLFKPLLTNISDVIKAHRAAIIKPPPTP